MSGTELIMHCKTCSFFSSFLEESTNVACQTGPVEGALSDGSSGTDYMHNHEGATKDGHSSGEEKSCLFWRKQRESLAKVACTIADDFPQHAVSRGHFGHPPTHGNSNVSVLSTRIKLF